MLTSNMMMPLLVASVRTLPHAPPNDVDPGQPFAEYADTIHVTENTKVGATIYTFDHILPQSGEIPPALLFCNVQAFKYDTKTGEILLTERLYRETICHPRAEECRVVLHVLFQIHDNTQKLLTLTIIITDENNVAPEFEIPFSGMTLRMCENSLLNGMSGDVFLASDNDKNTDLRYSLKSSKMFTLNEVNEINRETGVIESHLKLSMDPADWKSTPRTVTNEVIVQVSDGKYQMERPVRLNIVTECSNDSKFNQKLFRTSVEENVSNVNTGIILTSTGTFDQVQYHLIDPSIRDILRIDAETGEVFLDKPLDYEFQQRLRTTVELRDIKTGAALDYTILELVVKNVNDNPPTIDIEILDPARRQEHNVYISETHPVNVALAYFSISDDDAGNDDESIKVKQILGEEYFTLVSGFLVLIKSLDRESQNLIQVAVSACDQELPKKCSTTEINFIVTDENDHEPSFTNCPTKPINIAEDQAPGKLIIIVRASDKDYLPGLSSVNGELKYTTTNTIIQVDRSSGRIFLKESLDRETQDRYSITITAKDGGTPSLSTECTFSLVVTDVNDNVPTFMTQLPATTAISSQTLGGEDIFQFNVTDADLGDNGKFTLDLANDFGLFGIKPDGHVFLTKNVTTDETMYTITVIATDSNGFVATGDLLVEIIPADLFLAQTDPAVLSGALAGLCLVFIILLIIIIVKCCANKKRSTYECRKAQCIVDKDPTGSKQSLSGWTVEISGSECGNLKTGLIVEPTESEGTRSTGCLIKGSSGSQLSKMADETARDSGRGDSEKESINSSGLAGGVNCTKECQYLGHSDSCWMPPPSRSSRDENKFDVETLNSLIIGYSKQGFHRLSQTVLDKQTMRQYQLPNSDIQEQAEHGSSGYESSDAGKRQQVFPTTSGPNRKRTVHYL